MNHTYGECTFCGGVVVEEALDKACFWGDELVAVVADVPTGVCGQCGERYYHASVLREVERVLQERRTARLIHLPVFEFAAA